MARNWIFQTRNDFNVLFFISESNSECSDKIEIEEEYESRQTKKEQTNNDHRNSCKLINLKNKKTYKIFINYMLWTTQ